MALATYLLGRLGFLLLTSSLLILFFSAPYAYWSYPIIPNNYVTIVGTGIFWVLDFDLLL